MDTKRRMQKERQSVTRAVADSAHRRQGKLFFYTAFV